MTNQLQYFIDKFKEIDEDKNGSINYDQFKVLSTKLFGRGANDETADMYFRGIDSNNSGKLTEEEFTNFVSAVLNRDEEFMIKLAFRSFDRDKSNTLNCEEVKALTKYVGREMEDDEIQRAMEIFTGNKNGSLTFPQVYKMITGRDFDESTVNFSISDLIEKNVKPLTSQNPTSTETTNTTTVPTNTAAKNTAASGNKPASSPAAPSKPDSPATKEEEKKKSSCCLLI